MYVTDIHTHTHTKKKKKTLDVPVIFNFALLKPITNLWMSIVSEGGVFCYFDKMGKECEKCIKGLL